MKSGSWQLKAAIAVVGIAAIAAALLLGPRIILWRARANAREQIAALDERGRRALAATPEADILALPAPNQPEDVHTCRRPAFRYTLPRGMFRRLPEEPNRPDQPAFATERLRLMLLGEVAMSPKFRPEYRPTHDDLARWLREADPYDLLSAAFAATPEDVEAAEDGKAIQKALYLLMIKSLLMPRSAEDRWQRIEGGGRRGFLAGDANSEVLIADFYLPETRQFAGVVVHPGPEADMADIAGALGAIRIAHDPNATEFQWQPGNEQSVSPGVPAQPDAPR